MPTLNDPAVAALLTAPNCAVISTQNGDGSILSAVAWISLEDGELAVNSAEGRQKQKDNGCQFSFHCDFFFLNLVKFVCCHALQTQVRCIYLILLLLGTFSNSG